jgi:NADPH:quinone reductase-like Zn-dependent oxidoreductase
MKAAVVNGLAQTPVYADFDAPTPGEGEGLIHVTAAALSPLTKGRASGSHYSSENRFPFIAGVDGVGRLDDGTRVYFIQPRAPRRLRRTGGGAGAAMPAAS